MSRQNSPPLQGKYMPQKMTLCNGTLGWNIFKPKYSFECGVDFSKKISLIFLHVSQKNYENTSAWKLECAYIFFFHSIMLCMRHLNLVLHDLGKKIKHLKYIILGKRDAL